MGARWGFRQIRSRVFLNGQNDMTTFTKEGRYHSTYLVGQFFHAMDLLVNKYYFFLVSFLLSVSVSKDVNRLTGWLLVDVKPMSSSVLSMPTYDSQSAANTNIRYASESLGVSISSLSTTKGITG